MAEVTGLLDLGSWHKKIPGPRVTVRDKPLHPATAHPLITINPKLGQIT